MLQKSGNKKIRISPILKYIWGHPDQYVGLFFNVHTKIPDSPAQKVWIRTAVTIRIPMLSEPDNR